MGDHSMGKRKSKQDDVGNKKALRLYTLTKEIQGGERKEQVVKTG